MSDVNMGLTKSISRGSFYGDFSDKLNAFYTPLIFVVSAVTLWGAHLTGQSMSCFAPSQFTRGQEAFLHSYCWASEKFQAVFVDDKASNISLEPAKYQELSNIFPGMPVVILFAGIWYLIPLALWKAFCSLFGFSLNTWAQTVGNPIARVSEDSLQKVIKLSTNQLERYLNTKNETGCVGFSCFNCRVVIALSYLLLKLVNILVSVAVAVFLYVNTDNEFLYTGLNFCWTCFEAVKSYMGFSFNLPPFMTQSYPNVVLCDAEIHKLGMTEHYTVECVLTINLLARNVMTVLWFWLLAVTLYTCQNLIVWLVRLAFCSSSFDYILTSDSKANRSAFMKDSLRLDGRFLVKLFSSQSDALVVSEVVKELYSRNEVNSTIDRAALYGTDFPRAPPLSAAGHYSRHTPGVVTGPQVLPTSNWNYPDETTRTSTFELKPNRTSGEH